MTTVTYVPQPGTIPARVVAYLQTLMPGAEVQTGVLVDVLDQPAASVISSCHTAITCAWISCAKREGRLHWSLGPAAPRLALNERPAFEIAPTARAERKAVMTPARSPAPTNTPPKDAESAQASATASGREGATPVDGPDPQGTDTTTAALQNGKADTPAPGQREAAPRDHEYLCDGVQDAMAGLQADFGALAEGGPPPGGDDDALDEDRRERWSATLREIAHQSLAITPFRAALWSDGRLELRRGQTLLASLDVVETRELCEYLDRVLSGEGGEP